MTSQEFAWWVEEKKDSRNMRISTTYENYGETFYRIDFWVGDEADPDFEMVVKVLYLEDTIIDENGDHRTIWEHIVARAESAGC